MFGNFEFLKDIDSRLYELCSDFEIDLKASPSKAAILAGHAFEYFITAVCGERGVSFDRPKYITPLHMLSVAHDNGIISTQQKAVLDAIRYNAYSAANPEVLNKVKSCEMIDKIRAFHDLLKQYYNCESAPSFNDDLLLIDFLEPISVLRDFDMIAPFDKQFICVDEKNNKYLVTQFSMEGSSQSADFFEFFASAKPKKMFKGIKKPKYIFNPTLLLPPGENDLLFLYSPIPKFFEPIGYEITLLMTTKQRLQIIGEIVNCLCELHLSKPSLALGGFNLNNLWYMADKKGNIDISLCGLEGLAGGDPFLSDNAGYMKDAQVLDIESLGTIIESLLPEYAKISHDLSKIVAQTKLNTHIITIDKIKKLISKKELRKYKGENKLLKDINDLVDEAILEGV